MFKGFAVIVLVMSFGAQGVGAEELRLKTFRQINSSYQDATGVSSREKEIREYFLERQNTLPQQGNLNELNTVGLMTSFGLSSLFCEKLVISDKNKASASERWAHQGIDFSVNPSQGLSPNVRANLFTTYANLFWLRSTDAEELAVLDELTLSLMKNYPDEPNSYVKILTGVCSSVGGSFESLVTGQN